MPGRLEKKVLTARPRSVSEREERKEGGLLVGLSGLRWPMRESEGRWAAHLLACAPAHVGGRENGPRPRAKKGEVELSLKGFFPFM